MVISVLNYKTSVAFHNLNYYDWHLIMEELSKFFVITNELEKYMSFSISNKFIFIDFIYSVFAGAISSSNPTAY